LIPQSKQRAFILTGLGAEYHVGSKTELYANITQAYRPVQFADLSTPPGTDRIDPALRDARGYNADLGIRGQVHKRIYVDVSLYLLQYRNRIGTLLEQDPNGNFYNLRTNVGSSRSKGLELFTEYQGRLSKERSHWKWGGFISYAYNDARYIRLQVSRWIGGQLQKVDLRNNRVENAPEHLFRGGLNLQFKQIKLTGQFNYVSRVYTDANNTQSPSSNGQNGVIPSYRIIDLTVSCPIRKVWSIKTGINNLTNAVYFTRRAGGYPGPGALPADGRSAFLTITYQMH